MGQKSVILEAPGNFGTRESMVAFAVAGRNEVPKKSWIEATTSSPMISQEALKKPEVSPSGPGALFGFSLKKRRFISAAVGMAFIV